MVRTSIAFAVYLVSVTNVLAQPKRPASDIDQYRNYLLKSSTEDPKDGAVKVTFLGTAALLFDDGETQILVDGFFSRPSLLSVAGKIETNKKLVDGVLKREKMERLKALFITHSHYDHSFDVPYIAKKTKAKLYGSASTLNVGRGGDVPEEQLVQFEAGKDYKVGQFTVTVVKSKHSPPIKGINDDLGQTIDKPLRQPASFKDYKEGGSFDFLIQRGGHSVLVKPSANYVEGALDKVRADVLFLGTATLGKQPKKTQDTIYEQTVEKVKPKLVVAIHWDNFFLPLNEHLEPFGKLLDDIHAGFDFLIGRLKADKVQFGLMQGYQSVVLFGKGGP